MDARFDTAQEGSATVVTVAGRLDGRAVNELIGILASAAGRRVLDVSGVVFADAAGIDAIRTLRKKGVEIRGASPFIRLLLNGENAGRPEADQ